MQKKTILLVEDSPDDIVLTERALQKSGVTNDLVVAHDGQEALDYIYGIGAYAGRKLTEMPQLILLDLNLPRISGLEVLKWLRLNKATSLIPVVVLTSSTEDKDLIESYKLGANSYIRKPVDFNQFIEAAKQLKLYWLVLNEAPPVKT